MMNTKEKIEVMQAYLNGKTLQVKDIEEEWNDVAFKREPVWQWHTTEYRIKPEQNIIDLNMIVGSSIDCEFTDDTHGDWPIGSLINIHKKFYERNDGLYWDKCRIRENHWIYHSGSSKRPIPEGLEVIVQCVGNREMIHYAETDEETDEEPDWGKVTVFKIIGKKINWFYSWEINSESE